MRLPAREKVLPAKCHPMTPQEPSPTPAQPQGAMASGHLGPVFTPGPIKPCDCPAGKGDSREELGWNSASSPPASSSSPQQLHSLTYHCSRAKPRGLQCHPQINHRGRRNIWGSSGDLGERKSWWGTLRGQPDHPHPTKPHKHPETLSLFCFIIFHQLMWNCQPYWGPGTNKFLLIHFVLSLNHRYLHSWGWDSQHCHGGSCPGGLHWWLACRRDNHKSETSHSHTWSQNPCAETDFNSKFTFLGPKEGLSLNFTLYRQN